MCYFITRAELQALLLVERSKTYLLQNEGVLPEPIEGFGRNKLFDLKQSLINVHQHKKWPTPTDDYIDRQWRAILATRLQCS